MLLPVLSAPVALLCLEDEVPSPAFIFSFPSSLSAGHCPAALPSSDPVSVLHHPCPPASALSRPHQGAQQPRDLRTLSQSGQRSLLTAHTHPVLGPAREMSSSRVHPQDCELLDGRGHSIMAVSQGGLCSLPTRQPLCSLL